MKLTLINIAINLIERNISQSDDFQSLSFFQGVFNVLSTLNDKGKLEDDIFKEYLTDFIREDGIERVILERENIVLLDELEKMLVN